MMRKMHAAMGATLKKLQKFVDRIWYPPLMAFLAFLDGFVVVIPTDGILVSSTMLTPRRWVILGMSVAIGSTLGGAVLAHLIQVHGLPWLLHYKPGIDQSEMWLWTARFFDEYGLILVFAVAATPLAQQPTVVLAALAHTPIAKLALILLAGRSIKFLLMAYLGSHAPRLLKKLWVSKDDLEEAGVDLDNIPESEKA
jgi:membrane protein YqaA with SNARE-associated domain